MINNTFYLLGTPVELQVRFTTHWLTDIALTWWEIIGYSFDIQTMTWDIFDKLFKDNYFNAYHCQLIVDEFEIFY